ncbi:hypothetical protein BH11PSE4_BH11PSE4_25010 [soil metagenome]
MAISILQCRLAHTRETSRLPHWGRALHQPSSCGMPQGVRGHMACDIRIAAESANMTTGYAQIGLTGDYGIA